MNSLEIMTNIVDMYEMAKAVKADTGLPYDIWLGNALQLIVDVDGDLIPVSISKSPEILIPNKSIPNFSEVERYIIKYYDPLMRHWNGELTDKQILNVLGKQQ